MQSVFAKYASLVKFSHTVFALPFALIAYVYALVSTGMVFDWLLLVKILFCMVFARNTAMGFNRWADRDIDALNPRTASREIPSGEISSRAAIRFVILNAVGFIVMAGLINVLTLALSPVALAIVMGYSYTKRFTSLSHIVLGLALSIAPVGAYIAVTGTLDMFPVILAVLVMTWVSGFDVHYSLQDAEFDRQNGLHSIPAAMDGYGPYIVSIILHVVSAAMVVVIGWSVPLLGGPLYWTGAALFVGLLVWQHILFRPSSVDKVGSWFGLVNGASSLVYAAFTIADMLVAW